MEKNYWEGKEYSYFSHKNCEFFPCHKGADPENFNCLFCYCPLYALGINAAGISATTKKASRTALTASFPTNGKIMAMSPGSIRNWLI